MALKKQDKNTYRRIKSWLKNEANPETLIAHAVFDKKEREAWQKRLRAVRR